jgi:hypothetical protein
MMSIVCASLLTSLLTGCAMYFCVSGSTLPKWKRWMVLAFIVLWPLGWLYACVVIVRAIAIAVCGSMSDLRNWLTAD